VNLLINKLSFQILDTGLTRISHQLTTAAANTSVLTALYSLGLLDVLSSTTAGASVASLVKPASSPPRYARWWEMRVNCILPGRGPQSI